MKQQSPRKALRWLGRCWGGVVLALSLLAIPVGVFAVSNFPPLNISQIVGGQTSGGASALPVKMNADADGVTGHAVVDQGTSPWVVTGSSATPGYTRIQDGATTTLATVNSAGALNATGGGSATITAATAVTTVVKASAGRLVKLLVTTVGTGIFTCYDNASAASGTVLGAFVASVGVGTVEALDMPAANGITCVSAALGPVVTASYY